MGTVPGGSSLGDVYLFDDSTYHFDNAFISVAVTTPPGAAAVLGLVGAASFRRRRWV